MGDQFGHSELALLRSLIVAGLSAAQEIQTRAADIFLTDAANFNYWHYAEMQSICELAEHVNAHFDGNNVIINETTYHYFKQLLAQN